MRAAARRHPNALAALLSLGLAFLMVAPGFAPGRVLSSADIWWFRTPWTTSHPADLTRPANPDLEDAASQFQPLRTEVKRRLPGAPLWDPWISGGRPLLAGAQAGPYSPFNVPAWVMPLQRSLAWTALLILWTATFGMFLLARRLGMRFGGAMFAGISYGLSLWVVAHLSYPHDGIYALLPWLGWAAERLRQRPDLSGGALLAAVVGLQFLAGQPEASFQALLGVSVFFLIRLGTAGRPAGAGRAARRTLALFAGALLGGLALAALTLVPFAELVLHSADYAARSGTGVDQHLDARELVAFFLPDYWGRSTHTALTPFLFARSFYAGALPLMLAAVALVRRPSAERLWLAGAGAAMAAVIFGVPPFVQIATRLPLLSLGHNDRLVVLVLAVLAIFAGWGFDDLRAAAGRRRWLAAAALAVFALPFAAVVLLGDAGGLVARTGVKVALGLAQPPGASDPSAPGVVHAAALVTWVIFGGAALVLVLLRLRGLRAAWFAPLALLLLAADLLRVGLGYNPAIRDRDASQPETGALSYLASRSPGRFVGMGDVPVNVPALRLRLQDARALDVPILNRYNRLWRREITPELPDLTALTASFNGVGLLVLRLDPRRLRTLRLLGVRSVVVPPASAGASPPGLATRGLRLAYSGRDARVYSVTGALPRAWVAGAQEATPDGAAALTALTRPGFRPRAVAVSERRLPGVPAASAGSRPAGDARIASYAPERVVLDARLRKPGVVMLSDNWYPGWKATLDGRSVPVERVDYVLRGVVAGPGRHRVVFSYEPASWRAGWIVSLVALLLLAGAVLLGRRRRARA